MKKIKLHKPHGKNRYCGPAAISAVTGVSTDEAAAVVRHLTGKRSVKGMHDGEMVRALSALGATVQEIARGGKRIEQKTGKLRAPNLKEWMDARSEEHRGALIVAIVTGHFVAIKGDIVVDSLLGREPRHILSDPSRRSVFRRAWVVIPPAKPKLPETLRQRNRRQAEEVARRRAAGRRAHLLAEELGLKLERDGDYIHINIDDEARWVRSMAPSGLLADGEHPLDAIGDQCATSGLGWGEALDNLLEIKRLFPLLD